MPIVVTPEYGVPVRGLERGGDLAEYAAAANNTIELLNSQSQVTDRGRDRQYIRDRLALRATVTRAEKNRIQDLVMRYAQDPVKTSKDLTMKQRMAMTPPALALTHKILTTFGHAVAQDAVQIRHMVTNKLIEESENPDPRVRIKALELLGKISDVGLFAEKSEVTITHRTTDELRDRLREKLQKLANKDTNIVDAEYSVAESNASNGESNEIVADERLKRLDDELGLN